MDFFTPAPDGTYIRAAFKSRSHEGLFFCLSTIDAGDLSLDKDNERNLLLSKLNISSSRLISFNQTHSKRVVSVTLPNNSPYDGDGGVTDDADLVLSITVADCLPIALLDHMTGAFALVHSGWKGTGIVTTALTEMGRLFGTQVKDIEAIIGPGIGSCCYNVPKERAGFFSSYGEEAVIYRDGELFLDLKATNRTLLNRAGVTEVAVSPVCTCCAHSLGSFRREGPESFTRMLAVVGHF